MKISKFAKLVKNSGYCYVAHVAGSGIWLGTNVAMYRATELPEMEGRDQVRTVLDMSEKEFRTIHLVEIWPDGLGNVSGMNLSAYDREQETEKLKGDCISIYENVFTTYEKNYYVDCIVLSGRDVIGYASDKNTDSSRLEAHIKDILKKNSYKQNVKIFTEKRAFMDRVESLGTREPEEVPFREDDRYPGLSRDEIVKYLLMAITL